MIKQKQRSLIQIVNLETKNILDLNFSSRMHKKFKRELLEETIENIIMGS